MPRKPATHPVSGAARKAAAAFAIPLLLFTALACPLAAQAQSGWPNKPIRFIVPYPPGGPTDLMARILQPRLQEKLGTSVVVENRAGAGGNIGTDAVAKSPPDGYTILLAASGPMAVNPSLVKSTPFNPLKDLSPVIQISDFPLVLEINPSFPAKTVGEFIAAVKAKPPQTYQYASAGSGTPQHLAGALFDSVTGTRMQHVPYKGAGPALADVIGGQVTAIFDVIGSSVQHIAAGRLRPLAVTGSVRSPALPDVPTMAEAGVPGFQFTTWHGIAVPAGTPAPIIDRLNETFNAIFTEPDIKRRWAEMGSGIAGGTPGQFTELIRKESVRLGQLVRDSGATED